MVSGTTQIRVRYFDSDPMGYCNNANYPKFYEIGRDELFRELGFPYTEIEKRDIILPLSELNVKYIKPAHYDDLLTVKTFVKELPKVRIRFEYEIYNQNNELINQGHSTLAFICASTGKPIRVPKDIEQMLEQRFQEHTDNKLITNN